MVEKKKDLTLEEGLEQLEEIVNHLEKNNMNLEDALKEFQRGIEIYKNCNHIINDIEGKVKVLLNDENGQKIEMDFDQD